MRLVRLLLAGALVTLGLVLGPTAPAFACSCVSEEVEDFREFSDVIFAGTLTHQETSGGSVSYQVAVDRVYQGNVAAQAVVHSGTQENSCGLGPLATDRRYVVFATIPETGRGLETDLCKGTQRATTTFTAEVEDVLGAGHAPEPVDASAADDTGRPWASYAIGFLIAALAAWQLTRLGRLGRRDEDRDED